MPAGLNDLIVFRPSFSIANASKYTASEPPLSIDTVFFFNKGLNSYNAI